MRVREGEDAHHCCVIFTIDILVILILVVIVIAVSG